MGRGIYALFVLVLLSVSAHAQMVKSAPTKIDEKKCFSLTVSHPNLRTDRRGTGYWMTVGAPGLSEAMLRECNPDAKVFAPNKLTVYVWDKPGFAVVLPRQKLAIGHYDPISNYCGTAIIDPSTTTASITGPCIAFENFVYRKTPSS